MVKAIHACITNCELAIHVHLYVRLVIVTKVYIPLVDLVPCNAVKLHSNGNFIALHGTKPTGKHVIFTSAVITYTLYNIPKKDSQESLYFVCKRKVKSHTTSIFARDNNV